MCATKPMKDPILKASIPDATGSPEGQDDTGEKAMPDPSSRLDSVSEPQEKPSDDGSASGEKAAASVGSVGGVNPVTPLSVNMAWDEAVRLLRESGRLTVLPHFADADWFWSLVLKFNHGVLKDHERDRYGLT